MDRQLWLHRLLTEELLRCEKLQKSFEIQLKKLPKGSLLDRNGHFYRAYRENGKQIQKPIKDNLKLLQGLIMRRYIKEGLPVLKRRAQLCREFLRKEVFYNPYHIRNTLHPVYNDGITQSLFLEHDIDVSAWANESYKRNSWSFEEEHYAAGGLQVRSKSEALIGSEMEARGMVFRCEPEIWCGGKKYYPDFAILLPRVRRIVYFEHFGKMGDPDYLQDTMDKLRDYQQYGLYLGINFFFTWESYDRPLNMKDVHQVLDDIAALDIA